MADRRHDEHSPVSRDHHAHEPSAGDVVGEGVGGVSGTLTGAALGSIGGPIGTIIGGIAGAAGGWWTGRSISEAAAHYTNDEHEYRSHWDSYDNRPAGVRTTTAPGAATRWVTSPGTTPTTAEKTLTKSKPTCAAGGAGSTKKTGSTHAPSYVTATSER